MAAIYTTSPFLVTTTYYVTRLIAREIVFIALILKTCFLFIVTIIRESRIYAQALEAANSFFANTQRAPG